jgi:DNA-binding CsgD family transcriptional regulator
VAWLRWDRHFALLAAAVLAGRRGDVEHAMACVAASQRTGRLYPVGRHLGLRMIGAAAARDGWGAPQRWLRAAEQYFHDAGMSPVVGACRAVLRETGFRVTQRQSGVRDVPDGLRLDGVTAREYDVLRLLGARLTNNEIATHLHVSRRTVEKHVSSLLVKTGLPNRLARIKLAADDVARNRPV